CTSGWTMRSRRARRTGQAASREPDMPMRGRIEKGAAEAFVRDWIAAWNDRDLDAVLEHYSEDVELHSPRIATVTGREEAFVSGKTALAAYWRKALEDAPELNFILERVYVG